MIYFDKETLQFPRHSAEKSNELVLINELTGESTTVNFEDISDDSRFYMIDVSELTLRDGTYRYQIGDEVGLLQVGDYVNTTPQYNEKKQNIVYER